MSDALWAALYLQWPVVVGGVLHMAMVAHGVWPALARPVHLRWFGSNKTWRGLLAMPLLTALGAMSLPVIDSLWGRPEGVPPDAVPVLLGAVAGLGYVLAELPNSYFKRRIGIPAGVTPDRHRGIYVLLDQLDSAVGVALAYVLYLGCGPEVVLAYVLSFPITALLVKRLLFVARLKKSAL